MLGGRHLGLIAFALLSTLIPAIFAAVVEYEFDVTWVWAGPGNTRERPVIGINNAFPPPTIRASVNDTVLVKVSNLLGNESTSLHFHGLFMNGTTNMDGTSYISQCSIKPGASFTYNFTVQQPGTYWYHSHEKSQYPDGLRGALIIHDDNAPFDYDGELVMTLSDWYSKSVASVISQYDEDASHSIHDPLPDTTLINDVHDHEAHVDPGKTYLIRLVNVGAFAGQHVRFDAHPITIVEVDGIYVEPLETDTLYLSSGQRYAILLKTKAGAGGRYGITSRIDKASFSMHDIWQGNSDATATLVYSGNLPSFGETRKGQPQEADEMTLVPLDQEPAYINPTASFNITIDMSRQQDGLTHWMFDTVPFQRPETTPLLYSLLTAGSNASLPSTYSSATQPFVLEHKVIVELNIRNKHMRKHPLHLHGHNFQIIARNRGKYLEPINPSIPVRRDTVEIQSHETVTIRFRADNPGIWLFHCHMEWHAHSGLMATFVEAPMELQKQLGVQDLAERLKRGETCDTIPRDAHGDGHDDVGDGDDADEHENESEHGHEADAMHGHEEEEHHDIDPEARAIISPTVLLMILVAMIATLVVVVPRARFLTSAQGHKYAAVPLHAVESGTATRSGRTSPAVFVVDYDESTDRLTGNAQENESLRI